MLQTFKAARRVGVPLVAISTPDPAATVTALAGVLPETAPVVVWDLIRGMLPRNDAAKEFVSGLGDFDETQMNPALALIKGAGLPDRGVLFIHNAARFLGEVPFVQAAWNLRDAFKTNGRTLVLLGRHVQLPPELQDDVVVIDEPLPDETQLREIVRDLHKAAGVTSKLGTEDKATEALRGLPAFAAEQVTAMSLTPKGLNVESLWDRKRQQIEQTPGLKVFREGAKFESIGGCGVVKDFLSRVMTGQARPNAVVFVDEIEKMLGGKGDSSGVSQDQLGTLLSYMQDHGAAGMIFVGPPGAAKSAIAKAAGNEGGVPTIQLDLGAAKGSLVGQSEQQLRTALKVVTAVSNGRSLWIATCNAIADLPPELRRRFTLGTFFFDLPDATERAAIWRIYLKQYSERGLTRGQGDGRAPDDSSVPSDGGWTGAEIRQCCDIAWRLGCSLKKAAAFIVPVSKSAADAIQKLRQQAEGRYLSASVPGVYQREPAKAEANGRSINLQE